MHLILLSPVKQLYCLLYKDEDDHDYILLTDYLLVSRNDLQETPVDNADIIDFTDGVYLKDEQGHY